MEVSGSIQLDKLIAWIATLISSAICVRGAQVLAPRSTRAYAVLALMAIYWAILLPYYGPSEMGKTSELLPALNGFLLVYIGGVIRRTARGRTAVGEEPALTRLDYWAVWLLGLLVVPSIISLPHGGVVPSKETMERTEATIGTVLTIVGWISVSDGLRRLTKLWMPCAAVLIIYVAIEVGFTITFWQAPIDTAAVPVTEYRTGSWWTEPSGDPLSAGFRYAFSVMKLVFTPLFVVVISRAIGSQPAPSLWRLMEAFLGVKDLR